MSLRPWSRHSRGAGRARHLCSGPNRDASVERLDFSTLEKVPERLLSRELARREQDAFWRLAYTPPGKAEADWFYVYLHFEHMSNPKKLMALDMATYKLVACQELARRKAFASSGKLSPILSVVFYTGERRWRAATSLLDLVEELPDAPAGLDLWSYRLIDARRYPLEELVGSESPLLGLFRLEQLEDVAELSEIGPELKAVIEDEELAAAFVALINEEILPRLTPPGGQRIRITDLEELPSMLAQRIDRITHRWEMKGRAEGEKELFAAKFGEVPASVRELAASASTEKLETWAKRLLWAERPENVFEA